MANKLSVAFIGTGIMGAPIAGHILDAGYPVTVNNRTKSKAVALVERGAVWADTPADAIAAGLDWSQYRPEEHGAHEEGCGCVEHGEDHECGCGHHHGEDHECCGGHGHDDGHECCCGHHHGEWRL